MKFKTFLILSIALVTYHSAFAQTTLSTPNIIPQPASIQVQPGQFILSKNTVIVASEDGTRKTAEFLNTYLHQHYGFKMDVDRQESKNYIRLITRKFIKAPIKETYSLVVNSDGVSIEGDSYAAVFHGVQTLIQLLPVTTGEKMNSAPLSIPFVSVQDEPRFAYRGMHLDVTRHFFPLSFVKKYIDYLALHKMNYFHWHLTDDQGWRIETKAHPALMSKAAYRNGTIVGRYPGTKNDNIYYGGYYTQDEVKEVVAYAADRHITVIPEIEMPGHASAAIAAYPWLSCFPQKETVIPAHPSNVSKGLIGIPGPGQPAKPVKKVQETWGVFEDIFCAGNDSTFTFLQEVIDEVLPLFPSPYLHIGGDEAPKSHWKKCPACQARIKKEGLKDEHELQSYFIRRMEKYINAKGKTIIGWDEILEGGLAPNAIVMSWRGEKGGIEAAKQKHYVIMTPQKPLYFDHTQTKNEDSVTIGGYNPIEQVYAYDPIPKELSAEDGKYILGAQANVWAEYIKYPSKVEYHIFPRMSALSEVLWSPKEKRNWKDFESRLQTQFKRYELWKANYSKAFNDLKTTILPAKTGEGLVWRVQRPGKKGSIRIGETNRSFSNIDKDSTELAIRKNGSYQASLIDVTTSKKTGDRRGISYNTISSTITQNFFFNKATGKKVSITKTPNERYPGQSGAFGLVNGVYSAKGLSYPDWLGWIGEDIDATIDLSKTTAIDSVRMHTINQSGSWIYLPQYVEIFTSDDGKNFISAGKSSAFVSDTLTMGWITVPTPKKKTRYIKLLAKNYGVIPDGQPGGGTKAWIFADEIQVY